MAELVTVSAVTAWLGLSADTYGFVSVAVEAAEKRMRTICGNRESFLEDEYTEAFDGESWDRVVLRHTPVDSAQAVTVVILTDATNTVTVDSGSYRVDEETGILSLISTADSFLNPSIWLAYGSRGWGYPPDFRNVRVTYTGGYAAGSIPDDLTQIATEWAASMYQRKGVNAGMKSETLGRYSYTRADLTPSDQDKQFKNALISAGYALIPV